MKQVTYELRGVVFDTMIPAMTASCESLGGVEGVRIHTEDGKAETAYLLLSLSDEPAADLEADLVRIMNAKGLELVTPALSEEAAKAVASRIMAETILTNVRRDMVDTPPLKEDRPHPHEEGPRPADGLRPVDGDYPTDPPAHYVPASPHKGEKGRKISLGAAVGTVIVAVIIAILATFALTTAYMERDIPDVVEQGQGNAEGISSELAVIDRLFRSMTMVDLDDEALVTAVLKAYVAATGDTYAEYLTKEELAEMTSTNNGEMCGVGISVVNSTVTVNGAELQAIVIANVYPDSPAEEAGVLPGDAIMYVGTGEDRAMVNDIGYTEALARLKGAEGTECAFTVYRRPAGDTTSDYTEVEITAIRRKLTTLSVMGRVSETDPTVGIVKMIGFDNTTLPQFTAAVEELSAAGCTSFVFDLRNNPGGLLTAVEDVLVLFLEEGDVMISTKDNADREEVTALTLDGDKVTVGSGSLTRADVGKYKDLTFTVLVNEYSASAAELFTANVRDHELGQVVGVTTYGKGSMQTTYSLARYGLEGGLKLTTRHYFPPCGEGYEGIGITPHVVVELSEEAKAYNVNLLPESLDNQLQEAIRILK